MSWHRIDRTIGNRRYRIPTGARTAAERRRALALFDKLVRQGKWRIIQALETRQVSFSRALGYDAEGKLDRMLDDLLLEEPLFEAVDRIFPRAGASKTTLRYRVSFNALRAAAGLTDRTTVGDLAALDWDALWRSWVRSGSDWNHVRRAISRFCTLLFRNPSHPWRNELMFMIRRRRENKRRPKVMVQTLAVLLSSMRREEALAVFTVLATGMRRGELFRVKAEHLSPGVIDVPGTKTEGSARRIPVDPRIWRLVVEALPYPHSEMTFRRHWDAARRRADLRDLRLHDLRRVCAQLVRAQGRPVAGLKELLGHESIRMAEEYATSHAGREDAAAIADAVEPVAKVFSIQEASR